MKKLLIAGALVVGLSIPAVSQAEVSAFGVQVPVQSSEVSDNLRGGYVAQDLGDTFQVQQLRNSNNAEEVELSAQQDNVYSVFGINISGDQVI